MTALLTGEDSYWEGYYALSMLMGVLASGRNTRIVTIVEVVWSIASTTPLLTTSALVSMV